MELVSEDLFLHGCTIACLPAQLGVDTRYALRIEVATYDRRGIDEGPIKCNRPRNTICFNKWKLRKFVIFCEYH